MSGDDRSIVERLAQWASRLRSDTFVGARWTRTAVRDEGTTAASLPLTEVQHAAEDSAEQIARALACAISDVVDVTDKTRTVRLFPLTAEGEALRQGYAVKVDAERLRGVAVLSVAQTDAHPERRAELLKDVAYASIIGSQRAHAETLHTHLAASLESQHTLVQTVVGTLGHAQSFAASAIASADARAKAAEAREAAMVDQLAARTAERDKAVAQLEEVLAMLRSAQDRGDNVQKLMSLVGPFLHGAGVKFRANVNGTPHEAAG